MSNIYAALGSVIFPAILFSLGVFVVLVQSYYVKPQWKCYDDIYRDRYNFKGKEFQMLSLACGLEHC